MSGHIPTWKFIGSNNNFYHKHDRAIIAIGTASAAKLKPMNTVILSIAYFRIKNKQIQNQARLLQGNKP